MTQTTENLESLTDQQLRQRRIQIYRNKVKHIRVLPRINGKQLTPALFVNRKSNFKKFVELYFSKIENKNNHSLESENYGLSTRLRPNSDGYKAFVRFSETDYGSSVIKEMLVNQKKYSGFMIREAFGNSAIAEYKNILLPKKFPFHPLFISSKQKIYDLAIIYHEFAHTMVFNSTKSINKKITIYDERIAVMKFENPVRIRKGYEPRYTYTHNKTKETINIITGKKLPGVWLVNKYDPTILVVPAHKDALK